MQPNPEKDCIFGHPDQQSWPFSPMRSQEILDAHGVEACKDYIVRRMATLADGSGIMAYNGDKAPSRYLFMKRNDATATYLRAEEKAAGNARRLDLENQKRQLRGEEPLKALQPWSAKKWFTNACLPIYHQISNPVEARSFVQNDAYQCNVAARFVHLDTPVNSLTPENWAQVEVVRNHVFQALCGGEPSQFELLEKCLARTAHGQRNDVILVFNTPQGVGKSAYATFLGNVFGQEATITTNSAESMLGTHNGDLEGRSLVIYSDVELGHGNSFRSFYNKLKGATGESTERIRKMGKDGYMVENRKTYLIFTNPEKNPIAPESGDQRQKLFDVNVAWANDNGRHHNHYAALDKAINDKGAAAAYFHHLRGIYDPAWMPRAAPFKSAAQVVSKQESLHPFLAFIRAAYLDRQTNNDGQDEARKRLNHIPTAALAKSAQDWCDRHNMKAAITPRTPGKFLTPLGLPPAKSTYNKHTKATQSMMVMDPIAIAIAFRQKGWWEPPEGWVEGLTAEQRAQFQGASSAAGTGP